MLNRLDRQWIAASALILFTGTANASGFQLLEQNASGLGNAFAGSAAIGENASTIFYNPAAMTRLQARETSLGFTVARPDISFKDQGSSVGTLNGSGDGGNIRYQIIVPNAYAAWAISKDIHLGIGASAPFGLRTKYDNRWVGAAQSLFYEAKAFNINPSLAWRATDKISLGIGLNWQRLEAKYKRLGGIVPGADSITAKMKLDDDAWGWNVGALFDLSPTTRLGLSYRSRVKYHMTGNTRLGSDGSPFGNAALAGAIAAGMQSKLKTNLSLPDTFILSVVQKLSDRWEMLGDLSWTGWSAIPKIDFLYSSGVQAGRFAQKIDTNFRDTWRIALGANYQYNDHWKLKYGIAWDQSPVKRAESRLPQLPDNNRLWLSLGTQWTPSNATRIDLGAAYLYVRDTRINKRVDAASQGYEGGTLSGEYHGGLWVFGVQYSQAF